MLLLQRIPARIDAQGPGAVPGARGQMLAHQADGVAYHDSPISRGMHTALSLQHCTEFSPSELFKEQSCNADTSVKE